MESSSMTSLMSAFGRAYHSENEANPVFDDFLAKRLMSQKAYDVLCGYVLSGADFFEPEAASKNGKTSGNNLADKGNSGKKSDKNGSDANLKKCAGGNNAGKNDLLLKIVNKHIAANPLCRSAYAESEVEKFSGEGGAQYVILGAGLDTFAFRKTRYINHNMVFEVDHPLTQADKQKRMGLAELKVKENHKFVAVDFTKDDLGEKLLAGGFDKDKPSFFSWLGVTYYLTESDIEKTLKNVSALCSSGSRIVFDYPDENYMTCEEPRVKKTIMMAAAGGESMKRGYSVSEMTALLNDCGFKVVENLTPEIIQSRIIGDRGTDFKAFECVNYILAEKI